MKGHTQTNQLTKVADATKNNNGYPYVATPNIITYDANGNMLKKFPENGTRYWIYRFVEKWFYNNYLIHLF